MSDIQLNIMIIDDNLAIHQDFIKVLTVIKSHGELDILEAQLFGLKQEGGAEKQEDYLLPEFVFDTASQGREGVDKIKAAKAEGKHYALAFVDIRMPPGWDGIETIKRMWEIDPDIQVVICTAYSDYSWEATVQKLGMGDNYLILKKPFDSVAVRQLACALTKKWSLAKDSKYHMEILEKMVAERTDSLQSSLALLRSTIESSSDGIVVLDLNKKIIDYNENFLNDWGISKTMIDTSNADVIVEHMCSQLVKSKSIRNNFVAALKSRDKISSLIVTFKSGIILECCSQPHCMNGNIIGQLWNFRDITQRANFEKKLEYQASHDLLTALPNRVLLMDRIQQAIKVAERNKRMLAVVFFDLDRFKLVNDSLSHEIGDELLRSVAKRLASLVRKEDTLARLGGDEFVVVLSDMVENENIITVASKILESFKIPFKMINREILVTTSIGISVYPRDGNTVSKLLKNADLAMYLAKEQGGNQFQFYSEQLNIKMHNKFQKELELRIALEKNEFVLFYQPQYDIEKRKLLSVEALIRWQHPVHGLLLPLDFIPIAEESGLIVPIGEWALRTVCQQIKTWKEEGIPLMPIAINVSTPQLKQVTFAAMIKNTLIEYDVDPAWLELEIIENVIITHPDIIRMINQLKDIGVKIVLDDFGAGNSSLNYLKRVHVDRLKIDKSFIQNISESHSDEVIIKAIITMAKSLDFKVVAEGVENQRQMNFLKMESCDEVQGFLFSKPLSAEALKLYIQNMKTFPRNL